MFLEFIHQYADYNLWANELLAKGFAGLTEEQLTREIKSSFPSVRKTVMHLISVEDIWLQRIKDIKPVQPITDNPELSTHEMINKWLKGSDILKESVLERTEEDLNRIHTGLNLKGIPYNDMEWQMLVHCFNHSTYHRGQIVTILHQLDITIGVPGTDMITYLRQKKSIK